jgi:hypothetical protein
MTPGKSIPPITYCSDPDVQHFVEHDLAFWHPYLTPDRVMSAEQLFAAARHRFGDMRCWDLTIVKH